MQGEVENGFEQPPAPSLNHTVFVHSLHIPKLSNSPRTHL